MALAHNCLIRALNSILQQAPYIPDSSSPNYNENYVRDLLVYARTWAKTVEWHHHTEETCMFPLIESLAKQPDLLEGSKAQHGEFTTGLDRLLAYSEVTNLSEYRWEGPGGMKEIIDGFSESLMKHLNEEIKVFLTLDKLDSQGLRRCWNEAEEVAKGKGKIDMLASSYYYAHGL